jgi:molybdopterin converting factor small subunit
MKVHVKLFATLARFSPGGLAGTPFDVDLVDGATIADLAEQLKLPKDEMKVSFVNARIRDSDWVLQPDDEVGFFPPVGGG